MKVKQVALKELRYATRRLMPDDEFYASRRDARILQALGKCRDAENVDPPDGLDNLRAEYESLSGNPADKRWKEKRLREEIAALREPYRHE